MVDYNAPFNPTLDPRKLARQAAAGFVNTPADIVLGIPAVFGAKRPGELHKQATDYVNNALEAPEPYWLSDPTAFAARELGAAAVGIPAKALGAASKVLPTVTSKAGQYALRGLEAITPITMPLNPANIALNAAGGAVIGAGAQSLAAVEDAAQREANGGEVIIPANELEANKETIIPPQALEPTKETIIPPTQLRENTTPTQDGPKTWQGQVLKYAAPALVVAGAGAGVISAARQVNKARAFDDATAGGLVEPGKVINPEVERLGVVDQLSQSFVTERTAADKLLADATASGSITRQDADAIRGRIATQLSESAKNDIVIEAARTGKLPTTNKLTRSLEERELEVAALRAVDPDAARKFQDALVAHTELDTRLFNINERNWIPGMPGIPQRVTLHDKTDAELKMIVADAHNNPVISKMIQAYQKDMKDLLDFMVDTGLKSPEDALKMGTANPNYVHTLYSQDRAERGHVINSIQTTGRTNNTPLSERTHQHEAGALRAQDPIIAANEAFRKVVSLGLENTARRQFAAAVLPHVRAMKATNPDAPTLVRGYRTRAQDKQTPGWVTVNIYNNGKLQALEVAPPVAELLQTYPRTTVPLLTAMSRMFTSATTGRIAALTGSIQAPVSAAFAATAASITRPKGTRTGALDAGLQAITGGRVGLRGDPSFAANVVGAMVRDLAAESSRTFAVAIRKSQIKNGMIAKALGPAKTQQLLNSAQEAYDKSILAQQRAMGSAGTGIAHDVYANRDLFTQEMALTPEYAAIAQKGHTAQGIKAVQELASRYGKQLTPTEAVTFWRFYSSALDIVSGSATSAFIRVNQNRFTDMKALHGIARRAAGDPAEFGASPVYQAMTSIVPYSNITVQSVAAIARAIRNNPAGAISGIAVATVVPQAIQLASAILADEQEMKDGGQPRHVNAVLMENARGQSANVTIHIPGVEPDKGMRMVTDPALAPASAAVNNLLLNALFANTDKFWSAENASLRKNFTEFMHDRADAGFMSGLEQMGAQVSAPPILPIASYTLGDVKTGNLFNFVNSRAQISRDKGAPGFTDNKLFNDPINTYIENALESAFGLAAANGMELYRTAVIAARKEPNQVGSATAEQYALNFASTSRILPPSLQLTRKLPQRDAVGDALSPLEAGLERIATGWGDVARPGTVGSGRAMQAPLGEGRPAVHPEMVGVLANAHAIYNALAKPRQLRKAMQDQLVSIQSSPDWRNDPTALREQSNKLTRDIREMNQLMYTVIVENEVGLSLQNKRKVRFDKFNPTKGLEQFDRID